MQGRPAPVADAGDPEDNENAAPETNKAPKPAAAKPEPAAIPMPASAAVKKASDNPEPVATKLPKKPLNAYMMFVNATRAEVKGEERRRCASLLHGG